MSRQSRLGYVSQRIKLGISERRRPPAFAAARSAAVRMRTTQPERCRRTDGRARKTESVPAVGRRAFARWATWAKLLDARWALPSARRGTGDPAPNERGQTLPSRATQPRAEAERKRAETHAVSGNITGGDERRTGDVTEDTRLGSGDQGAATHRPWIALRDQRRGRVRSAWPSAWARHVAAAVVRAMPPLLGQQLPGGTDRPPAHGGWCWRCPLSSGLAERWPMHGGGEGGGPVRTGS